MADAESAIGFLQREDAAVLVEATLLEFTLEHALKIRRSLTISAVLHNATESIKQISNVKERNLLGRSCRVCSDGRRGRSSLLVSLKRLASSSNLNLIADELHILNLLDVFGLLHKNVDVHGETGIIIGLHVADAVIATAVKIVDLDSRQILCHVISLVAQITATSSIADGLEDGAAINVTLVQHAIVTHTVVLSEASGVDFSEKHVPAQFDLLVLGYWLRAAAAHFQ